MNIRRFDKTFGPAAGVAVHASRVRQSAERLRTDLMEEYHAGESIPSGRVLADRLGVSRNTVRRMLTQLSGEGWLRQEEDGSYRVSDPKRRSVNTTGLLFPFDQDILLTSPFYRDVGIGISQIAA
ncbi:MAG: GntR family transcriptional regulator [Phycisphaerae bacterium]|nr:GntR family transcriptional regulator [Phycisphaerae bacterium]